jgi:hypothetical protein
MTAPLHTRVIGRRLLLTGHFADPVDITQADDLGDVPMFGSARRNRT